MSPRHAHLTSVVFAAALATATTASSQALTVRSLEISPSLWSYAPQNPTALSATSLLLPSNGPDDLEPPADRACEATLLIEDLHRDARVTPLATPSSAPCRQPVRLSPTRALLLVDDGVYLLDDLGGSNRVRPIELAAAFRAVRLDDDAAVLLAGDPFARRLFVLSDLGGAVRVTETPGFPGADGVVPLGPRSFLLTEARSPYTAWLLRVEDDGGVAGIDLELRNAAGGLVLLSSTSFLFAFDDEPSTTEYLGEDDGVYLFTDLGGSNQRTELATPYFASPREIYDSPALARLSGTRAVLPSSGPDGTLGNDDDRVLVLDDLGGTNEVVEVPTPGLAMAPLRLRGDRALLGLGGPPSSTLAALLDVGGANVLGPSSSPLPFLSSLSDVLAVGPEAAVVAHGGADPALGNPDDDVVERISGFGASPLAEPLALRGIGSSYFHLTWLGNGRAFKSDWVEPLWWPEGPHHLHVLEGLGGLTLEAQWISLRFHREYGASLRATARLLLPEPTDLAASDLTVRIGNAWQTIPASEIEATPTGYLYQDRRGKRGFLRLLEYDAAAGRLSLKGRGFKTRAATTRPDNLVLSLEGLFFYAAESLDGTKRGDAIVYRAP